jgi:P4 family phage/plasmid primase-like protien
MGREADQLKFQPTEDQKSEFDKTARDVESECLFELYLILEAQLPDAFFVLCPDGNGGQGSGVLVQHRPESNILRVQNLQIKDTDKEAIHAVIALELRKKSAGVMVDVKAVKVANLGLEDGYKLNGVDMDEVRYLDRHAEDIVRELALQKGPDNEADAEGVLTNVVAICVDLRVEEDMRYERVYRDLVFAAWNEWLARSTCIPELNAHDFQSFCEIIEEARANPAKTAKRARACLWERRRRYPVLTFIQHRLSGEGLTVKQMLMNIDTVKTDELSLIRVARVVDESSSNDVLDFVRHCYSENNHGQLHDEVAFKEKWDMPTPDLNFRHLIVDHLRFQFEVPWFIHDTIPSMFEHWCPVRHFWEEGGKLHFQLDFTHEVAVAVDDQHDSRRSKPVTYALDHSTGVITQLGVGVVHRLYGSGQVRQYFEQQKGVNGMAELVRTGGFGLRYDAVDDKWRSYDDAKGIWRCKSPEAATSLVAEFLSPLLNHIQDHTNYMNRSVDQKQMHWNWISARHAHAQNSEDHDIDGGDSDSTGDTDGNDENIIDIDSLQARVQKQRVRRRRRTVAGGEMRKKRRTSTVKEVQEARKDLRNAIDRYVETPRHIVDVLKAMQHRLPQDFTPKRERYHLLPCPNGVVNLKTGELLKHSPDYFFTHACATEYDASADISPALAFFEQFFPADYHGIDEQAALVRFCQQWFGYGITQETSQEFDVWMHGHGANGKTLLVDMLAHVLGREQEGGIFAKMHSTAMCKERGVNNGALTDAMPARTVTISEMDESLKINEDALKVLVSGESGHVKQMFGRECEKKPVMKLTFLVNSLPTFKNPDAHSTVRRHVYVPMLVIFLDLEKASDRAMRDKYEAEGKPKCLIAKKNVKYFDEHVAPYKQAFLTFFVKGAMVFYEKSGIQIPQSLNDYQCKAVSNKAVLVTEYIEDNLETCPGMKLLERDIYADFKKVTGTDALVLNATAFYKQLKSAIDGKSGGGDWAYVKNYNGRDGSCRKDANGKDNISKGQLYENLTFKNRMKAPWHVSDQASEQKSRKRKTESETGGQATRPSENSADVREKNKLSTIPPQDLPLALPLEDYAAVLPPHPMPPAFASSITATTET